MQDIHYFAGGNTARGFYSCFPDILPVSAQKRMYYIKGGPGVGKSTLMKRVAAAARQKGLEVTYYHCSSDPDSLDGISIPALGMGMMDGTAPHVYDPVVPGARDTLISLGDFLDEKALAPHAGEIAELQKQLSARFGRCYRYLAAAEQVLCAAPQAEDNAVKLRETAEELTAQMPVRGGAGSVRRLFGAAFTPKGRVECTDLARFERRFTVDCPFGGHATALMQRLTERALDRGLHVVQLLDPLIPERIQHVLIPEHGLAFCTGTPREDENREQSFDRNACELMFQRATEQLACAKSLHDELERFYVQHMDFARWQTVLDGLIQTLA